MPTDKEELIRQLQELSILMDLNGDNPFKCRAYSRAARTLEGLDGIPREWIKKDILPGIKGLGKTLIEKIRDWAVSGNLGELDEYRDKIPSGLMDMMNIPGLGTRKINLVWKEKNIVTIEQLEDAARSGKLDDLPRFSSKISRKILEGIEQRKTYSKRHHIATADRLVELFTERLGEHHSVSRIEVAGSYRRRRETIKDIDILVISDDPTAVVNIFVTTPGVISVVAQGETRSALLYEGGIPVDMRVVPEDACPAALNYFTGSMEHNTELRGRARKMGFKLNEYGLYRLTSQKEEPLPLDNEGDIYRHLGLEFIAPELRENTGEFYYLEI